MPSLQYEHRFLRELLEEKSEPPLQRILRKRHEHVNVLRRVLARGCCLLFEGLSQ